MHRPLRILIVEDSEDDAFLLLRELRRASYEPIYQRVETRADMQAALESQSWDLVVTDHVMPTFDSTSALELVRETGSDVPVIIVSGSIGEEFAVEAMKSGANDYVMKGNLARLVPAIERELREAESRRAHRRAEEAIQHLAYHDALTDLINRHEFERRLEQALASARDRDLHHALLYLDLDQFKIINDTCGHQAGDDLLKQLAVVLEGTVRDSDTLARLGGDEFGVLLESCPMDHAQQIAEHIREAIAGFRFVWQETPFGIGVSVGIVAITATSGNVNEVLSAADVACYAAKDLGRNRVHLYTHGDAEIARRHGEMKWVSKIKQALEDERFVLFRQTIVPIADTVVERCHWEFLIRLKDETGTLVAPGAFIPAAERYNMMGDLDRWVIRKAVSHLAQVETRDFGTCFINLSGTSLSDGGLYEFIRTQLREFGLPPELICFEITETSAVANLGKAVGFIREIKKEGCLIALDDFGSGMSSFSYLKSIPVDFVKIDGGFVRNMAEDPMDAAIVEAINQIGHVMGLRTIAEFVETDAVLQKLVEIGVDYAQGYGIETPQPLTEE